MAATPHKTTVALFSAFLRSFMSSQSHSRVRKGLYAMVSIFLLAMATITGLTIHNNYLSTIAIAERQQLGYARTLAEHASRTLGESDRILDAVIEGVALHGGLSGATESDLYDLFAVRMQHAPQVGSIFAIDAQGKLIASTSAYPAKKLDVTGFDHFRFHRGNQKLERFISRPYQNRLDGAWRFSISRRLNGPDGRFAGYIGVALVPKYFDSFNSTLPSIPTQRISLIRNDGSYLVVAPFDEHAMSLNIGDQPLYTSYLRSSPSGTFHNQHAGYDRTDRIVSYCRVPGTYPVVAVVSFEERAILASWRQDTILKVSLSLMFAAVIMTLSVVLGRRMRQLELSDAVIREEKELAQTYLNVANVMFLAIDRNHRIILANRHASRVLGYGIAEIIGKNWFERFLPEQVADQQQALFDAMLLPGRFVEDTIYTVRTQEGEERIISWHNACLRDETGAVTAVLCSGKDITQRVHAEQVAHDRENLISALLNAVPESMMLIDSDGIILAVNETAALRVDSRPEQMLGTTIWEHIPAELAGKRRERVAEVLATRQTVVFEDQRGTFSFYHVYTPIIDPDLQIRRVATLAFDITEIKRTQMELRESEETFRQIFNEAPDPILLIDGTSCFVDCNQAAVSMLRAESREQVLMRHPSFFSPETQPDGQLSVQKADAIIRTVFEQQNMHFEWLHHRFDGTDFYADISLKLISLRGQKMQLVHWRDITEWKETEKTLRKLSTAVEQNPAAIVITDSSGAIEYANPKFYTMTEYTSEEVLGQNPRFLKAGTQTAEHYGNLWKTITAGREWQGEFHNRSKRGRLFWEMAYISPIKDASGAITHFVGVKEDITDRKLLQDQLASMAHFDSLTGLPNRALFFDRTSQAINLARRENRRCAVLFIDLDGFKKVNDTYGHEAGDQLLCQVAQRIRSSLRTSDTVARMGGDEFTVILSTLHERSDAGLVAEGILALLSEPIIIGTAECRIGASIGISIFPDDADDAEKLLHGADTAMYEVKRSGKSNYCFYLHRSDGSANTGKKG